MAAHVVAMINRFWAGRSWRAKSLAVLLLPLPILIAASAGMYRAQQGEQRARAWVQHTLEVRDDLQEVLVCLLDAEASARDFLLTGDPSALGLYWESREVLGPLLDHLTDLVSDNSPQYRRSNEARELVRTELDDLAALCQNAPKLDKSVRTTVGGIEMPDSGRDFASRIRGKLTAMQMEEDRLLQARSQAVDSARLRVSTVLVESVILALFFQLAGALLLTGALSGQIRALEANTRLFCAGLPTLPFVAETHETLTLENGLRQASTRLAEHERELRENEERFRTMFKDAPIACHEIDCEGVLRYLNPAACALFAYPSEELAGKYVWDMVSRESRDVVRRHVLERLSQAQPATPYECHFVCRDGSLITVEIHETLIRNRQGAVAGMRSALLDVTARKMVNMAVRKVEQYAQELRTKNEELLLALGAAREASATKGKFLAAMSHEFRTPLNGIIELAELMFDHVAGPVSEEQKEYLGDILASSRHLLHLVNDVLDMAKVESGKMEFRMETVPLAPLLCEVRDVLRILAERKNISVSVDTGDVDQVVTDASRLKQVVYNYLSNAIKFSYDGGSIQVRARWEGGRAFRIEVEDSGAGIEPADITRLFADFQQLDSAKSGVGTGLGLVLTKHIVEQQGGTVGVRSQVGIGSVFFAVLPIRCPTDSGALHPARELKVAAGKRPGAVNPAPGSPRLTSATEAVLPR
jgi:PAS domain S-box-containing protein